MVNEQSWTNTRSLVSAKCGNNPQLILNNASCNCNNFINVFDGKLGQFVLKCKNSETEDIFLKKEREVEEGVY